MSNSTIIVLAVVALLGFVKHTFAQDLFGDENVIIGIQDAKGASSVFVADLDGDGDLDVLSASRGDSKIAWYENDGSGNFSSQQVITQSASDARSVHTADLDGDGDQDVLSASFRDDKIAWYENDGSGVFGPQQVITTNVHFATSVYAADLDGDEIWTCSQQMLRLDF